MEEVKNYPPYLDHAKPYKAKTNAESIRALSDEDLANFLIGFSWLAENGVKICYKTIAKWLQQPAKEEQSMSEVVARYFQNCDICNQEFQLKSKTAPMSKAILPGQFIPCDGRGPTPTLIPVNLCPACLQEMSEYLQDKYILKDIDYAGIQTGKKL